MVSVLSPSLCFAMNQYFLTVGNNPTHDSRFGDATCLGPSDGRCDNDQKFEICLHSLACLLLPFCHPHAENMLSLAVAPRGRKKDM